MGKFGNYRICRLLYYFGSKKIPNEYNTDRVPTVGIVVATLRKFIFRHYYQLKSFRLEVRVKLYRKPENFEEVRDLK